MFMLKLKMWILMSVMFAIVYGIVTAVCYSMGISNFYFYLIVSFVMLFIQYMVGPKLIEWTMHVKYLSESENPKLHHMIDELARQAGMPKPKIGIAQISIPNAFAFGRWKSDGRICVTEGIMRLLKEDELRAVLGHEMSHLKNRDVLTITLLSVIPMILYRIFWGMMFSRGGDRKDSGNLFLVGLAAFLFYFITNLLVLYASRIREYFADKGSVELGNSPHTLASALYKLVYGSARADRDSIKEVEGARAFFVNDPATSLTELRELRELDLDGSGTIDQSELIAIRSKEVKLNFGEKLMEIFSTHPNMLKRIKKLSSH